MEVIQSCKSPSKIVQGLKMATFNLKNKRVSSHIFFYFYFFSFLGNTNRRIHISFDKTGMQTSET